MKYDSEEISNGHLDIRIFTTIYGRILIGELMNVELDRVELQNVYLINPLDPKGMVPIHPDSIMKGVTITLFDRIIETETLASVTTIDYYIQQCLKHILTNTQSSNSVSSFSSESNKVNPLINWRDKFN